MRAIYRLGGRFYEWLILALTLGSEEKFKREALARAGLQPGQDVLDWGCGTGLSMRLIERALERRGRLCCVDVSPPMLSRAVRRARCQPTMRYQFILRQGFDLTLDRPVDVAVASYSLGVLPPRAFDAAVSEIWRNVRPGGRIVVIDMYIPEARSVLERLWHCVNVRVSQWVFAQDFSGRVSATVTRYFEPIDRIENRGLLAFALIGRRRETPIPPKEGEDE